MSDKVSNIFLGTSAFAAEVLRALARSPHRPSLVVTPPDRGRGRGRKVQPSPAAAAAGELGIPVHRTASVNQPESVETVRAAHPQVAVVCAFGQLIKAPLLDEIPMLNIHPSLLPRWRGAAPIERALLAGDERTGVCVMRLTAGLDSGPVAMTEPEPISDDDDFASLSERLAGTSGRMIVAALDSWSEGDLAFTEQPDDGVTYADKIERSERRLDPARPAIELERTVRALHPHIGTHLELRGGERLGVTAARAIDGRLDPGSIEAGEAELRLGCAEGVLAITRLKPAGGRDMAAADYLCGHSPPPKAS